MIIGPPDGIVREFELLALPVRNPRQAVARDKGITTVFGLAVDALEACLVAGVTVVPEPKLAALADLVPQLLVPIAGVRL